MRLGRHALDALYEEFKDLGVVHALYHLPVDLTEHQVALLVLEGVVEARLRAIFQALNEGINLVHLGVGYLDHGATIKRVNEIHILIG